MQRRSFARSVALTPEEQIRRARLADPIGLGALYDQFAAGLFRTAYRICGSRSDAEDVVHDLFVGLPEALGRYDDRGKLDAWLTRIIVRLALMHVRSERRRRTEVLPDTLPDTSDVMATDRAGSVLELNALQDAVMSLPDELRTVFVLKHVEGYAHDEIATLLGISNGASRVRLNRAVAMLRRSLD